MKSIGVHQCLIPLSKGEGHQPKFPLDFSISKIKRMFTVEVDEDWNGKTTQRGLFSSKPLPELYQDILESCEKGKTIKV